VRIVHVINGYLPHDTAGTQIHVRDLCRGLRGRGHDVEIFTRLAGPAHGEFTLSQSAWDGVPVTGLTNNFADVDRFELLYTHPTIDARFDAFLERARPDLVHVHHLTCLSTSMIAVARARGLPVVMSLHDYWMVCLRGQRIRPDDLGICDVLDRDRCLTCLNQLWPHLLPMGPRSLVDRLRRQPPAAEKLQAWERHVRRMLEQCQALVTPSRFHRDRFIEWGAARSQVFVAPYGVSRDVAGPPRQPRPRRHVGFIGSVIPTKGVHVLCEAFSRLDRADLVLHIHGETPVFHGDATYVDRVRQLVPPHLTVRFHGRYERDDLPAILDALDVLVVPSLWWESYCLTVREGALAGLPVIASRLGGIEDAIEDGIATGFRAGDAGELARQLARALDEPAPPVPPTVDPRGVPTPEANAARLEAIYQFASGVALSDTLDREG
jgi:glycosyltransferase involved in cell wall biosynthesis